MCCETFFYWGWLKWGVIQYMAKSTLYNILGILRVAWVRRAEHVLCSMLYDRTGMLHKMLHSTCYITCLITCFTTNYLTFSVSITSNMESPGISTWSGTGRSCSSTSNWVQVASKPGRPSNKAANGFKGSLQSHPAHSGSPPGPSPSHQVLQKGAEVAECVKEPR